MMCYVCNDLKRAESKKSSAKRVLFAIDRLIPAMEIRNIDRDKSLDKQKFSLERELYHSASNINLMCGHCVKFNKHDIKSIEDSINRKIALSLIYMMNIAKEDDKKAKDMKNKLCSILRGHYPMAYRLVEKTYIKECIRRKENEII